MFFFTIGVCIINTYHTLIILFLEGKGKEKKKRASYNKYIIPITIKTIPPIMVDILPIN